jgi:hypothetical protein
MGGFNVFTNLGTGQMFLLVPEYVKALLIILIKDPLSMPMSLPQLHCIFRSRAVKLYFLPILAL